MSNTLKIAEEIAVVRSAIDTLESSVEGDFSAEQEAESETLIARLGTLKEDLAKAEARDAAKADADETVARIRSIKPSFSVIRGEKADATMGEYMSAFIGQASGDPQAAKVFRTLSDVYMSDVPGIIPTPVLSSVIDRFDSLRPVANSFTQAGPVLAKTMEQPYVTQHVAVNTQAAEGDEVASQKYTVSSYNVTASTIAGAVVLSQQTIDWSSPSALNLVSDSFAKTYNNRVERLASTALNTAASENVTWGVSTIATLAASLQNAITALEDNLSTVDLSSLVLYLSPDEYAKHQALFTAEGVAFTKAIPDFPRIVRGRYLPAYSAFLADTSAIRLWETRKGLAQLIRVSSLEWELGMSGYLAFDIQSGAVVDCSYAGS